MGRGRYEHAREIGFIKKKIDCSEMLQVIRSIPLMRSLLVSTPNFHYSLGGTMDRPFISPRISKTSPYVVSGFPEVLKKEKGKECTAFQVSSTFWDQTFSEPSLVLYLGKDVIDLFLQPYLLWCPFLQNEKRNVGSGYATVVLRLAFLASTKQDHSGKSCSPSALITVLIQGTENARDLSLLLLFLNR